MVSKAMESVQPLFQSWRRNDQFKKYVTQVQGIIECLSSERQALQEYSFSPPTDKYIIKRTYINFEDLVCNPAPFLPKADQGDFAGWIFRSKMNSADHSMLKELLDRVSSQCSSRHEQRYAADLVMSFKALQEDESVELKPPKELTRLLERNLMRAKNDVEIVYEMICSHLQITLHDLPCHGKDNPATRAEFSHPDAAIVLTCLSYYYGGLSDQQMHASFEALLQSDCATEEYARWVKDAPGLPAAFREITGVNLSNTEQCRRDVFQPLRRAKGIMDFYMASIVFPKEMKEFPNKLSSSGWDIAEEKTHPTTGFSGTNDSRYILPLSIA
jgi:hypothetical protein